MAAENQDNYVEVDRRMFAEIFWNPLIIMTGLVVGVALFCAAAELHGYAKAGFLATTTVLRQHRYADGWYDRFGSRSRVCYGRAQNRPE